MANRAARLLVRAAARGPRGGGGGAPPGDGRVGRAWGRGGRRGGVWCRVRGRSALGGPHRPPPRCRGIRSVLQAPRPLGRSWWGPRRRAVGSVPAGRAGPLCARAQARGPLSGLGAPRLAAARRLLGRRVHSTSPRPTPRRSHRRRAIRGPAGRLLVGAPRAAAAAGPRGLPPGGSPHLSVVSACVCCPSAFLFSRVSRSCTRTREGLYWLGGARRRAADGPGRVSLGRVRGAGARARPPDVPPRRVPRRRRRRAQHRPHTTRRPCALAWAAASCASRLLPTPGSPASVNRLPRAAIASIPAQISPSSRLLPTKVSLPRIGSRSLICARSRPERVAGDLRYLKER